MEPFIYQDKSNIPYFSLESWQQEFPDLIAGFSGRFSSDDKHQRNYALHVGDNRKQTIANRKELVKHLGYSLENWTCGEQVHLTHVTNVLSGDMGRGSLDHESAFSQTDGMITDQPNIFLASFYADCVPLFFYSPDQGYTGIAHAGWKGTVGGIARKMVEQLHKRGAQVENLRVAIGPSIGKCCYEVNNHVMDRVKDVITDTTKVAHQVDEEHYHLDLKKVNHELFLQMGLKPSHIMMSNWCTSCDKQYFYSHRRDQGDTGRMVAWIAKK